MNITTNLINREYNGHTITIDEIDEIGPDGTIMLRKVVCYVVAPNGDAGPLRVSPYLPLDDIHTHAVEWVDAGCPEIGNPFAPAWG